jgi:hypothetical protein
MRQEIEHALELGRNVVPLLGDRFTFEEEQAKLPGGRFPGQLGRLPDMNAINVYWEYFDEAMGRLTKRFLKQPAHGPLVPTPAAERAVVQRLIENAARAQPGPGGRDWQWLSKTALSAPKLELARDTPPGRRVWKWNPQLLATGYVLQRSADTSFVDCTNLYEGQGTEFAEDTDLVFETRYYHVKATGGFGFMDSPWSNVVETARSWSSLRRPLKLSLEPDLSTSPFSLKELATLNRAKRARPWLWLSTGQFGQRLWNWTPVLGADRYILQCGTDASFTAPTEFYDGPGTEFTQSIFADVAAFTSKQRYRVGIKDHTGWREGVWSNVVEV